MPMSDYIQHIQKGLLGWLDRSCIICQIVEIHGFFNMSPETLFLTVNIMDRFLSKKPVSELRLELLGLAALFIASKLKTFEHHRS